MWELPAGLGIEEQERTFAVSESEELLSDGIGRGRRRPDTTLVSAL